MQGGMYKMGCVLKALRQNGCLLHQLLIRPKDLKPVELMNIGWLARTVVVLMLVTQRDP